MTVKILLAEDNPADVYLIQRALKQHEVLFELDVAENGKLALAKLRDYALHAEEALPSLIVLDLNLPQHDGIEILQSIHQIGAISKIPVVVLTSSDSPKDQMRSLASGARLYIRKPSNLEEFMAIGVILKGLLSGTPPIAACH